MYFVWPLPQKKLHPLYNLNKKCRKVVDKNSGAYTTLGYWVVGGMGSLGNALPMDDLVPLDRGSAGPVGYMFQDYLFGQAWPQ